MAPKDPQPLTNVRMKSKGWTAVVAGYCLFVVLCVAMWISVRRAVLASQERHNVAIRKAVITASERKLRDDGVRRSTQLASQVYEGDSQSVLTPIQAPFSKDEPGDELVREAEARKSASGIPEWAAPPRPA